MFVSPGSRGGRQQGGAGANLNYEPTQSLLSVTNLTVGNVATIGTLNISSISIGNSTANVFANSILVKVANSTATSNVQPGVVTVGTSVVNTSVFAAGANVILDTIKLSIGNSTVNVIANSLIATWANSTVTSSFGIGGTNVGANVIIGTVDIRIGNSTVNSVSNSLVQVLANSTVTSSFGISGANLGANVILGTVNITIGNSTVNSVSNSLGLYLANSTTVSNLTSSKVSIGANAFLDTVTLSVGNTVANLIANSILVKVHNATASANLGPGLLVVGTQSVNVTHFVAGANVTLSTVALGIGNSTVNALANSLGLYLADTAIATALTTAAINVGANAFLSTTTLGIGNSTANLVANSIIVKVANASGIANLQPTQLYIGNSTVNTHIGIPTGAQYAGDFYLHANGSWVEVTAGPGGDPASRVYQAFTATDGQTSFTVAGGYNVGFIDVYINGVKLADDESTQDGSTVVLDVGAILNSIVEVVGYVNIPLEEITSVAAGSDTHVQFNDATVLNGTAGFTFTKGTNTVVIANTLTVGTSIVNTTIFSLAGDTGLSRQSAGSLSVGDGTVGSASGWLWANAILFSDDTDQVPALFRSGATLNVKLGDDSALTNVAAASVALTGQLGVGANVVLDTVRWKIGNSTINSYANSIYLNIGGRTTFAGEIARFSANTDEIPVPAAYLQVGIQNFNGNSTASGDLVITADTGTDSTQYLDIGINSSTYNDPNFSIGGALAAFIFTSNNDLTIGTKSAANILFHANGGQANNEVLRIAPGLGLIMTPNTTISYKLLIGNSTINTHANSTLVKVENATASANLGPGVLTVGTQTVNTTIIAAGANVLIGTVDIRIGNSTVNTVSNSIVQIAANSTVSSTFGIGGANCGANVLIGTVDIRIGNSTVNSMSNSIVGVLANSTVTSSFGISGANVGANVILDTIDLNIGNSTVNSLANSLGTYLANSTTSSSLTSSKVSLGANAFLDTVTLSIGNSTVNATANSLGAYFSNSTTVANLTSSQLSVGANVFVSTTTVSVGNSTANLLANSILVKVSNSTGTSNLQPLGLTVGSSVVNSTVIVSGGSLLSANIQTNPQTGTTYTLVAADSGKLVTCNNASAITVTVPAGLPIGFRTMVMQYGAGNVTISNTSQTGALIFSRNSLFVSTAKYGTISVIQPSANDYIVDGAI